MKKRWSIMVCVLLCSILCISCKSNSKQKEVNTIAEMKSSYNYFVFPNTDWGMEKENVLKQWNLKEEDFEVTTNTNAYEFRKDEVYTAKKPITLVGLEAMVSFTFSSIPEGEEEREIGLTRVVAEFEQDAFDTLMEVCAKTFGETYSAGNLFFSEGKLRDLPEDVLDKTIEVFQSYLTTENIE